MANDLQKLLEQGRKSAWSSWGPKQWQIVLEHLGYTVAIEKERTTIVKFTATLGDATCTETKEPRYRHIVFYDLSRWFTQAGGPDACAAKAGLPTIAEQQAAKKRRSGEAGVGTCPCCFGGFKIQRSAVSLHGYQRPGFGYILGRCYGAQRLPFEISCDATKEWRAVLNNERTDRQDYRERLLTGKVPTLTAQVPTGKFVADSRRPNRMVREYQIVEVALGQGETQNPFQPDKRWERVSSYDTIRDTIVERLDREIGHLNKDIKILDDAIAGWTFKLLPGFEAYAPK